MNSEDFVRIFYSNFTPNIDWANIDEITWMYQEKLFTVSVFVIAQRDAFIKRTDLFLKSKKGFLKEGESVAHLVLKSFAEDYLTIYCSILPENIRMEYPLIGFEVDVIDKDLRFPAECGDTNALKLEKYLSLPTTRKMLVLPYPHTECMKVFEFSATLKFFEYIKHKQKFLNRQRSEFR